ncbi:DUF983 domain-containing protein [Hephaestia mangrovi]|uniref:DUF983 domain-containing protein n=1 Tax=Hephaestia mangrovi TaxID=2873268 RepID=UPI003F704E94
MGRAGRSGLMEADGGGAPTPAAAAIKGLCPRCGARTLFTGPVAFAQRCRVCGLDFQSFNVGDGPAALLTLVLGAIIVAGAAVLQVSADPPFWLQLVIWIPVTAIAVVFALRLAKAALLVLEYRNAAREGRIKDQP